jgi:hypothetical protein
VLAADTLWTMVILKRKSVYKSAGIDGDFGWMIERPEFARSLFIFNDNETQFEAFHQGRPSGLFAGGGNAIIRPLQDTKPQRAAGIPTGDHGGYSELSPQVCQTIDRAIQYIRELLQTGDYDEVVFSYDSKNDTLGAGIFKPHESVKKYIYNCLMNLP